MTKFLVFYLDLIALVFSLAGVLIVTLAGSLAFFRYLLSQFKEVKTEKNTGYNLIRQRFGEKILLSLEFFVGADLIKTIATPSFIEIGKLAAIVGIRTLFAYFLSKEIESS
jgi:uncharacterized membrane protein